MRQNQTQSTLPRSQKQKSGVCEEDLNTDIEENNEKNIGGEKCLRWFHMKRTEFLL